MAENEQAKRAETDKAPIELEPQKAAQATPQQTPAPAGDQRK